ncbi:MAG TPA: PEP-CTERM sorting domain-containing protein, partial [Edaphobacter sp.]
TTAFLADGFYSGTLNVEADDTTEVFLNGVLLIPDGALGGDGHCADALPNCSAVDSITLHGVSLSGINTLTFVVQQAGDQSSGDPSGLDFNASLTQVPEPGSLMLLGTGLVGSAGMLLRRKRA